MKLTETIYVYKWTNFFENNCNSYYIGGGVKALIDPGLSAFVPDLLARMEDDGIDRGDIRYVINTHSHPDHFEGSEQFAGCENVSICLMEEELAFHRGLGRDIYAMFGFTAPGIPVDLLLEPGTAEFGNESFEIIHVPGHSPGSLALWWPTEGALFSGDVIFSQNVGRTDFPGGSSPLLKDSITRLSELDARYLLPGHMEIVEGREAVRSNFAVVMKHIFPYM
ncbi:MAG: MBL fold metallo-hydrolase [Syntrophales bacterium]|jgi:glyoxylase-like metal-dependent hydrolase (beta-lactamase superfamily II)|nr:MBL fold metallo-hydrolase [Syntrophales bacterium]MCK9528672.1 MBL fold metallo-hydrolase [Syntrophales bacterium]MDX9922022.1 MBL fold metallo-hydrolase [Syntrophales bacterium]